MLKMNDQLHGALFLVHSDRLWVFTSYAHFVFLLTSDSFTIHFVYLLTFGKGFFLLLTNIFMLQNYIIYCILSHNLTVRITTTNM